MKLGVILCSVVDHKWQPTHEYDYEAEFRCARCGRLQDMGADTWQPSVPRRPPNPRLGGEIDERYSRR